MSFQETLRADITNKIIDSLNAGVSPWRRPWIGGMPTNLVTKKPYRGINTLLLAIHQMQHNLSGNVYATFNQWKAAGCTIKKRPANIAPGGYGANIVFYSMVKGEKTLASGETKETSFPLLKCYTVFNSDQVDGADKLLAKRNPSVKSNAEKHEEADRIIAAYTETEGLEVFNSDRAYYSPTTDKVSMPKREQFVEGTNSYYGTYFHELVHSTGAEKRLNRLDKFARFGSSAYAMEELVAEIGGCFLLGTAGLPVLDKLENHVSYVDNWLSVLKRDHKAVFQAAAAATAAADYVLKPSGVLQEEEELTLTNG